MKSFLRKYRLINIAPEHCFDVTLADFEQIVNNDFIKLEAELLNDINYFSREPSKSGITFAQFLKKLILKKQKPRNFTVKSLTSFTFHFFLTRKLRHNPYIIELLCLEFLM